MYEEESVYRNTIDYLFTRLPMYSRVGSIAYKKDLGNTIALCAALGNPHQKFKTVHIAGTNGKGSVSHMLASILQHAGYKTGLYTSPHLKDFRERIKINGQLCSKEFVIDFTEKIKPEIDLLEPSFFEITVAMAFQYFSEQQVDIAIIETGLGGRLDSTNIISPEVSVITNISLDHTEMLGTTLQQIAFEKAGIIKPQTPVVLGELNSETLPVFQEKADKENAPLFLSAIAWTIEKWNQNEEGLYLSLRNNRNSIVSDYLLDLRGSYQLLNVPVVLETCEQLRLKGWQIGEGDLVEGLKSVCSTTGFQGRWQMLSSHPKIILDVAHNAAGIKHLVQQLPFVKYDKLRIIIGLAKEKNAIEILSLLPQDCVYYFTEAAIPRAFPSNELREIAGKTGRKGNAFNSVELAFKTACMEAGYNDLILVCGSVFVVAEVL